MSKNIGRSGGGVWKDLGGNTKEIKLVYITRSWEWEGKKGKRNGQSVGGK